MKRIRTRLEESHDDTRKLVECGILRVYSDAFYGLLSIWWSVEEVLVAAMVPVMVRVQALE